MNRNYSNCAMRNEKENGDTRDNVPVEALHSRGKKWSYAEVW